MEQIGAGWLATDTLTEGGKKKERTWEKAQMGPGAKGRRGRRTRRERQEVCVRRDSTQRGIHQEERLWERGLQESKSRESGHQERPVQKGRRQ